MTAWWDKLERWFESGALVRPDWTKPCTAHLARAMARIGGAALPAVDPAYDRATDGIGELLGAPKHLVFVLLDALGENLLERLPEDAFLRRHRRIGIHAVFPSATSASLTTLATAAWPAMHGVYGWWQYLPQEDRVTRPLPDTTDDAARVFPLRHAWAASRHAQAAFFPERYKDSGFSRWSAGLAARFALGEDDPFAGVPAHVAAQSRPSFTYVYVPRLDELSHYYGPSHPDVTAALVRLDGALARLRAALPAEARLVVSADHGQVDIAREDLLTIGDDDPLRPLLRGRLSGEPTVPFFHVVPGRERDFAAVFERRFGDDWALLTRAEVLALGLFGPVAPEAVDARRIGELVALSAKVQDIQFTADGCEQEIVRGVHGGLRGDEVRVPLVIA